MANKGCIYNFKVPAEVFGHLTLNIAIKTSTNSLYGDEKFNYRMEEVRSPRKKPNFKISPIMINNIDFQEQVKESLSHWKDLKNQYNYRLLQW